jgi:hypothetical protein
MGQAQQIIDIARNNFNKAFQKACISFGESLGDDNFDEKKELDNLKKLKYARDISNDGVEDAINQILEV